MVSPVSLQEYGYVHSVRGALPFHVGSQSLAGVRAFACKMVAGMCMCELRSNSRCWKWLHTAYWCHMSACKVHCETARYLR
jgi:hypothetical protein